MHEFSLAQNIIEIVEENAQKNNVGSVSEVVLEIGTLAGVEIAALDMAIESLQKNTILENAFIRKDIVKAIAVCVHCQKKFSPEDYFAPCPFCQELGMNIISGKELRVKSITGE